MAGKISVTIDGALDSGAVYDEERFLAADAGARMAITNLYESGATIANIEEAVQGGLTDADGAVA